MSLSRYACYQDFLGADPQRRTSALEIGHDWRDGQVRYRVCYYTRTGELTAERLSASDPLDLEDFERGVEGVEIIRIIGRAELDRLLGPWPMVPRCRPRTLDRLRELLSDPDLRPVA